MDVNLDSDSYTTSSQDSRYFYHQNTLYSVYSLSDKIAALKEAYQYDPYGKHILITDGNSNGVVEFDATDTRTTLTDSTLGNPYHFTGRRFDDETGFQLNHRRYYDAGRGRWVSKDPIGDFTDSVNFGNGYSYGGNDPINLIDPSGFWGLSNHRSLALTAFYDVMVEYECCMQKYSAIKGGLDDLEKGLKKGSTYPDTAFKDFLSSHFGKKAYWHGMAYKEKGAFSMRWKVLSRIHTKSVESRDTDRLKDKGFIIGEGLHTLADTYTRSHVKRENGYITHFQEYDFQSKRKHLAADKEKGSTQYNDAYKVSKQLIYMVLCAESGDGEISIMLYSWLKILPTTKFKGSDAEFEK